ncbi:MAG TPA: FHA domain-containing protein [Oligoflexia bacterium]|nr:FHA domain-containing protein [Oligoflexia bacterium]HMR25511.1 FHA domain-containing protein [Oligoflexia bacterium]
MKIIVKKNSQLVQEKDLGQNQKVLIGRSKHCDLILPDPHISRKHASIEFIDNEWILNDLDSDNGTRLKGKKIDRSAIQSGEHFFIGSFQLMLASDIMKKTPSDKASSSLPSDNTQTSDAFLQAIAVNSADTQQGIEEPSQAKTEVIFNTVDHEAPTQEKELEKHIKKQKLNRLENAPKSELSEFSDGHDEKTVLQDAISEESGSDVEELEHEDAEQKTAIIVENQKDTARLVCLDENRLGQEIPLNKEEFTLGSANDNDIKTQEISDSESSTYATLTIHEDKVELTNTNQQQDTYVDGLPVNKTQLKNHDIVTVGGSSFEFVEADSKPRAQISPVIIESYSPINVFLSKTFSLPLMGLTLGLCIALFSFKWQQSRLNKKIAQTQNQQEQLSAEAQKIIVFHLSHANELLSRGQYDEAEARIRLILSSNPKNNDALKLLKKVNALREEEHQKTRDMRLEISRRHTQIRELLEKGDRLVEEKKFAEALKIYNEAKSIDPQNMESQAALKHLEQTQEEQKRQDIAKKNELVQLRKMFNQALEDFENNKYSDARKLLNQVVATKDHQYYEPAQNILNEMRNQTNQYILNQVAQARKLVDEGQSDAAYKLLLDMQQRYPNSNTISKELEGLESEFNQRAAQAYREGLTLLELANDPAAAMDQFEKVLQITNNPKNEYYKKAKEQLDKLKLGN